MAASSHTESAISREGFTPSEVPMLAFGFCLGAILGFIAWYLMYFYMLNFVFPRIDGVQAQEILQRDRRNSGVDD
ncbi:uncharacterized protein EAF02_006634 [Botrytis sinoallii]|uniref:uncharacterized protein n=1 Tax=Botrytis sinoallii TaxID=1463999 RepID=UPI0019029EE2|nr:uncharacterized protein EAF02_006634 [Botrytis sinoallii]KAF7881946.1 hypothetical protein EAF02_006634 [Botrytis sinoallii]